MIVIVPFKPKTEEELKIYWEKKDKERELKEQKRRREEEEALKRELGYDYYRRED